MIPTEADRRHAGVRTYADLRGGLRDHCDAVVVGSGPGGAVAALELARRGLDVVVLEEGPPVRAEDLECDAGRALSRVFREGGLRVTRGNFFMPTLQAIALGGGSLVNSAICLRPPDWVFDRWAKLSGCSELAGDALAEDFAAVESYFGVSATEERISGERNLLFKRGCEALGWKAEPMPRNVRGCRGSAECFTGCRNQAKQSTDLTAIPEAISRGARVYTSVRVEEVVHDGRRASAVRGKVVEPFTGRAGESFEIEAERVVLAAGCVATPLILLRSGIAGNGHVGAHLQVHPGFGVFGVFGHDVEPWRGAAQGWHCMDFLREGMKLEVLWSPPGLLAMRLPGAGPEFKRHLWSMRRMAPFDVIVSTRWSEGRVRRRWGSAEPDLVYRLDPRDCEVLREGVGRLVEICWAAGAVAVMPGIHGLPDVLESKDQTRLVREHRLRATDLAIGGTHVFGTTRMGSDPRRSVVDARGRVHTMRNVYVADTGIFPTSPAVNPMLTCMAMSRRVARELD